MKHLPKEIEVSANGLSIVDKQLPGVIVATANSTEMASAIVKMWNDKVKK